MLGSRQPLNRSHIPRHPRRSAFRDRLHHGARCVADQGLQCNRPAAAPVLLQMGARDSATPPHYAARAKRLPSQKKVATTGATSKEQSGRSDVRYAADARAEGDAADDRMVDGPWSIKSTKVTPLGVRPTEIHPLAPGLNCALRFAMR